MFPITVGLLLFGDHAALARRVLSPLLSIRDRLVGLRIGANAIGDETKEYLKGLIADGKISTSDLYVSEENCGKYPVLRAMVRRPRLDSEFFVWFDDDSVVTGPPAVVFDELHHKLRLNDIVGPARYMGLAGRQQDWIRGQRWFTGRPFGRRVEFAAGGFWGVRSELLYRFDWPDARLWHNGGDVMLGALAHQNFLRLGSFSSGVAVNADAGLRSDASPRRGMSSYKTAIGLRAESEYSPRPEPTFVSVESWSDSQLRCPATSVPQQLWSF